jgi:proteasome-associated ATPase
MTIRVNDSELVQRILADSLPPAEEKAAVEGLAQRNPPAALSLLPVIVQQKHRCQAQAEELKKAGDELITKLRQTPWHPATFLRFVPGAEGHALVATERGRLAVILDPEADPAALRCGSGVFLNRDQNVLLKLAPELSHSGSVGAFSRFHDGRVVIRGAADEEIIVEAAAGLREGLKKGDLLLYNPESHVAWEEVEKPDEQEYLLAETPKVTFDDIGGLDEVIEEIMDELTLHFFHPELVQQHELDPVKGILLSGPPGNGKTSLAKALANFFSQLQGVEAKFLNVRPGAHRSMWYGKTEENVRELFGNARRMAAGENCFVCLFFDDIDQLGARGDSITTAIDTRVLPAFLHEMDGLEALDRVLLIGASNRPDLLDEALLRPGRFGDKVFRIPRPGREAAREIFRKYLKPSLPYHTNGKGGEEAADEMIEAALAALYSPNGEHYTLATLTFRDGSRKPLVAPQVVSGALIANAVRAAKQHSCRRAVRQGPVGITAADLQAAIGRELSSIAQRLKPGPALHQMLELPQDLDVVKVEVHPRMKEPRSYEYLSL